MDGYAVRAADARAPGARLTIIGASAAGRGFAGKLGTGEAVRIFTGAPVPDGGDAIVIQENTQSDGTYVVINAPAKVQAYIRPAGLDFREGEVLLGAARALAQANSRLPPR